MDDHKELSAALHKSEKQMVVSIGQFVMRFADMESEINRTIGTLLNLDHLQCQLVVGPILNVNIRLDILQSLAHGIFMPVNLKKRFEAAIKKARNLNDDRNWIVHDSWGGYMAGSDEWQKIKPETKTKFRLKARIYSPAKIDQKGEDCIEVEKNLIDAASAYANWRDALKS